MFIEKAILLGLMIIIFPVPLYIYRLDSHLPIWDYPKEIAKLVMASFIVWVVLCSIISFFQKRMHTLSSFWQQFWKRLWGICIIIFMLCMIFSSIILFLKTFFEMNIGIDDLIVFGEDLLRILVACIGTVLLWFSLPSLIILIINLIRLKDLTMIKPIILCIISAVCGSIIMWLIMFKI